MPEHGPDAAVWRAGEFMEFDRVSHLVALRVRAPRGNVSSEPTGFDILYVRATSPALDTSRVSQDSATAPGSRPLLGCTLGKPTRAMVRHFASCAGAGHCS